MKKFYDMQLRTQPAQPSTVSIGIAIDTKKSSVDLHRLTTDATPNPDCGACKDQRRHSVEEFLEYHPDARKGHSREHGTDRNQER